MIGNNGIILNTFNDPDFLPNHPRRDEIKEYIIKEYWKYWKKVLIKSEKPAIQVDGLGFFVLDFKKAKLALRHLIKAMRSIKQKYPEKYLDSSTMIGNIFLGRKEEFRILWKQVDELKKERMKEQIKYNENYRKINKPEKIKANYEWIFEGVDKNSNKGNS